MNTFKNDPAPATSANAAFSQEAMDLLVYNITTWMELRHGVMPSESGDLEIEAVLKGLWDSLL